MLHTLSNAEYSIKYLKKYTIRYRSTLMNIRLCANVNVPIS